MTTDARTTRAEPSSLAPPEPATPGARKREASVGARLIENLLRRSGNPPIEFELQWSGERVRPAAAGPVERLRIADRLTFARLLWDPDMGFGDGYSEGKIEVEGDLVKFMIGLFKALGPAGNHDGAARPRGRLQPRHRNTHAGSRKNIHRHYDIGNDFYRLWLDDSMAYTCAYYPNAHATLEQAQFAKMQHVCRKLRLTAMDRVVEAGCGWGGLALHIAGRYGAKVRAFNISREQLEFARRRAREQGLSDRIEFVEDDYRNIAGTYDAFVSVGMLEHVGVEHYPELGRVAQRSLTAQGRGLIHTIGRNRPGPLHPWIERRIFPGAYPPSLAQMMRIFEPSNLSVLDVENLRPHYALTLRAWLERFEGAIDKVETLFPGGRFARTWRLYLAGSIAAFETGALQLFQVLFTKGANDAVPLTRTFMYPR